MIGAHNLKSGLRLALVLGVVAAVVALPAQAMAKEDCSNAGNDPTAAQYCSVAGVQGSGGEGNGPVGGESEPAAEEPVAAVVETEAAVPAATTTGGSTLPFTGLDVGILAAVAAALVATGLVLRRLTASGDMRS